MSEAFTKSLVWAANSFLLDALFDKSPLALAVVDEKFTFIKVSKSFALQIHARKIEDHLDKTIVQVLGKDAWKKMQPYFARAKNGEHIHDQHIKYCPNSTDAENHFLLTLYPLPPLQKKKLIGIYLQDITLQKKEDHFLQFKANTSRLFNSSLDSAVVLQQIADLAVKYVADWCSIDMLQDSSFKMVAISHKNPKKVSFAKKLREKYPATLETNTALAKVIETGEALFIPSVTPEMTHKPNVSKAQQRAIKNVNANSVIIVPLVIQKKAVGAITFVLAESKERYTESELQMAEQLGLRASLYLENLQLYDQIKSERRRLIKLLENVPCAVWETVNPPNDQRSHVTFINSYAQKLLGYPLKKWLTIPQFSRSITHPEDKERVQTEVERVFKSGKAGLVRFRWQHKSGKYIWVESRFNPIYNTKGAVIGLRGVSTDISERMKLEQRKDNFIATASHELKTPLTSIKVYTQVIKANNDRNPSPKLTQHLIKMEREVDRLTELVAELLDISRIQRSKLEIKTKNISLTDLLVDTIQSLQPTTNHKITLGRKTAITLRADRHRLGQVFSNLIANAIKYSPRASEIILKMKKEKDKVIISIQDFGIGIPVEHQERIFERFYRVSDDSSNTFPGLGMGLFISKNIVERHGGQLWVESQESEGSTFFVSLPIRPPARKKNEKSIDH